MEIVKDPYSEIKYFSKVKTVLNKTDEVYLHGENNKILVIYPKHPFYYLRGYLSGNIELFKWLQGKTIKLDTNELKVLSSCKKKDIIEVSYDDARFRYMMSNDTSIVLEDIIINYDYYEKLLNNYKNYTICDIPDKVFNEEILEIYLTGNKIAYNNGGIKILEVSSASLEIIQKPIKYAAKKNIPEHSYYPTYKIKYSDTDDLGKRLIILESHNEDLGVDLEQFFVTL